VTAGELLRACLSFSFELNADKTQYALPRDHADTDVRRSRELYHPPWLTVDV